MKHEKMFIEITKSESVKKISVFIQLTFKRDVSDRLDKRTNTKLK